MRTFNLVVTVVLILCAALPTLAQSSAPSPSGPVNLFFGFSYANINLGSQTSLFAPASRNFRGISASAKYRPRKHLSITLIDFGIQGARSSLTASPDPGADVVDLDHYQLLFGAGLVFPSRRFNAFVNGLAGFNHSRLSFPNMILSVDQFGNAHTLTVSARSHAALAVGTGLEWNLNQRWALRLFEMDFLPMRIDGTWHGNWRSSAGVILRP
jgi:hypothetical protein